MLAHHFQNGRPLLLHPARLRQDQVVRVQGFQSHATVVIRLAEQGHDQERTKHERAQSHGRTLQGLVNL